MTKLKAKDTLNRPLRDLRISLTDLCNLRCGYCMPAEIFDANYPFLKKKHILTADELEMLARAFVSLGVAKLRLTGGEPLLRSDLLEIIERFAAIEGPDDIALTTNGLRLTGMAESLKDAGLHRVTVSLDALHNATFKQMS